MPTASRRLALSMRCMCVLVEIGEPAHDVDVDDGEEIHDAAVACVHQYIGLPAHTRTFEPRYFFLIELDHDGDALRLSQPIAIVLDSGKRSWRAALTGRNAAANTAHPALEYLSWHHVEHDRGF